MRMRWTKTIAGALTAGTIGIATAFGAARSSFQPQPPEPGLVDIGLWLVTGQDALAAFIAVASGISGGWAIWQMFQPAPAVAADVVADGERTRADMALLRSESAQRAETTDDKLGLMMAKLADLETRLIADANATPAEAEDFARVANSLAGSGNEADLRIAELLADGEVHQAYDAAMALAYSAADDALAKARQAAQLIAPFDRELAIAAWQRALALGGPSFDIYLEISRLHQATENWAGAKVAADRALALASEDWQTLAATGGLGEIAIGTGDFVAAERHFQTTETLVRKNAAAHPDNWLPQLHVAIQIEKRGDVADLKQDHVAAAALFEEQRDVCRNLIDRFPPLFAIAGVTSTGADKLARAHIALGHDRDALDAATQAVAMARVMCENWPEEQGGKQALATALGTLGKAELLAEDADEAYAAYAEAKRIWEDLYREKPGDEILRRNVVDSERSLAVIDRLRTPNPAAND